MRGNPELLVMRHFYGLAAITVLISTFAGCAAVSGSCLSYGHSCWGAHGKRSGSLAGPPEGLPPAAAGVGRRSQPPPYGERWFLSRLMSRQLQRDPLAAQRTQRARMQAIESAAAVAAEDKHSGAVEKLSRPEEWRDLASDMQGMTEEEPSNILLIPANKNYMPNGDDQTIKIWLYKFLKNLNDKLN